MQRQTLPHTDVWHGKQSSHWAEWHSPEEHSLISRAGISPAAPHTSYTPALLATREDWFSFPACRWHLLEQAAGDLWGLSVPCSSHLEYSPDAVLHQHGCSCSRSLQAVGGSMHCKGCQHCNQFQGHSFWFTFSTSFLRNLNCLFNPLALGQKHSAVQPSTAGANLIPIETENLPGIKPHMGTI